MLRAGGFANAEAAARAANAEPWEPMPGMVKRQYPDCRYWSASAARTARRSCLPADGDQFDRALEGDATPYSQQLVTYLRLVRR